MVLVPAKTIEMQSLWLYPHNQLKGTPFYHRYSRRGVGKLCLESRAMPRTEIIRAWSERGWMTDGFK